MGIIDRGDTEPENESVLSHKGYNFYFIFRTFLIPLERKAGLLCRYQSYVRILATKWRMQLQCLSFWKTD